MDKKIIFAFLTIVAFVISGCQGNNNSGAQRVPYIGGTNGLLLDFQQDSPPEEILDDGSFGFQAVVKLNNEGEFKIPAGNLKVSLQGIDPNDFGTSLSELQDKSPPEDMLQKRKDSEGNLIEGSEAYISFPSDNSEMVPKMFTGNTEFTLRADVCYSYQTNAVSKLCVLNNLLNVKSDAVCQPTGTKQLSVSGAPVQITNLRQIMAGKDKIGFTFDVGHSNNGYIFEFGKNGNVADCPRDPRQRRSTENRVRVTVDTGMPNLNCPGMSDSSGSQGYVLLTSGKRSITCYQDLPASRSDYEKDILITLEYNYEEFKDKKLLVKHLVSE